MKKWIGINIIILIFINATINAQQILTPTDYILKYKDLAIREMKRMGVPASITLAQGILESESGNSELVKKANNHFGIKCKNTWTAQGVTHDDDAKAECFRKYNNDEESFRDHSNFLRGNDRYSFLFKLDVKDYKAWAYGLKKAGYATNPAYPQIVINNIEKYNLQQYTLVAADDVPKFEPEKYKDDTVMIPPEEAIGEDNESTLDTENKILKINGKKCVLAKKGTSLLVVATKNNIAFNKLLSFNELGEDGILTKDQYFFLEKKMKIGENDFYIVKENETIFDVAQKNGIQLQYLLDYNNLTGEEKLTVGSKLFLNPKKQNK